MENLHSYIAIFCDGMQFSALLILFILYILHKRENTVYWKVYIGLLTYLMIFTILKFIFNVNPIKTTNVFYRGYIITSLMILPLLEGLLYSLLRQGQPLSYVIRRICYGEAFYVIITILTIYEIYPLPIPNKYLAIAYTIGYCIWMFVFTHIRVLLFDRQLNYAYSDTTGKTLKWLNSILWIGMFMSCFLTLSTYYADLMLRIAFDMTTIIVFSLIGYFVYMQKPINPKLMDETRLFVKGDLIDNVHIVMSNNIQESDKDPDGHIKEKTLREIGEKLEETINTSKPYLDPDLTLADMSSIVGVNSTYLSYYINNVLGVKFNNLINTYRFDHAKKLLIDHKELPIDVVARQSGFNSIATMQRMFSDRLGCTASIYRQLNGKIEDAPESIQQNNNVKTASIGSLLNRENDRQFQETCEKIYPGYKERLLKYEPSLTHKDIALCMLAVLGYDSDSTAEALCISPSSLNVTRCRLRSKLRLKRSDSLEVMLTKLLEAPEEEKKES